MIFSVVMTVALGALLAMSHSDGRAEALKQVVNNLNFALDSMSRTIRTGYNYHCGTSGSDLSTPGPQDCSSGAGSSYFAFKAADGTLVAYCLTQGQLMRQRINSGSLSTNCADTSSFSPLTSTDVSLDSLQFIVQGSCSQTGSGCTTDSIQPKVTILVTGTFTYSPTEKAQFHVQTSVAQRIYDQ